MEQQTAKQAIHPSMDTDRSRRTNRNLPLDENGNFVRHVPGLEYYGDFLSPKEQIDLLDLIYANLWQEGVIARRQQFYGEVYYHTSFKSKVLQGCSSDDNDTRDSDNSSSSNEENNISSSDNNDIHDSNGSNSNRGSSGMESRQKEHQNTGNSNQNDDPNKEGGNGIGIPIDDSGMRKWLDKTMPFFEKEGLTDAPTQILINEYRNNMGIASHFEDFDAFGPVILTISLISPLYMTLKKPTIAPTIVEPGSDNDNGTKNNKKHNACDSYDDVVKILLEPGSLLIMKDDARFKYRHGIGKYKWIDIPPPQNQCNQSEKEESSSSENPETLLPTTATTTTRIKRDDSYRRVSLTIRHLLSTRRKVQDKEDESDTIKDPSVY